MTTKAFIAAAFAVLLAYTYGHKTGKRSAECMHVMAIVNQVSAKLHETALTAEQASAAEKLRQVRCRDGSR